MVFPAMTWKTRVWQAARTDSATAYAFQTARHGEAGEEFAITDAWPSSPIRQSQE
jgi:hypothetical protein